MNTKKKLLLTAPPKRQRFLDHEDCHRREVHTIDEAAARICRTGLTMRRLAAEYEIAGMCLGRVVVHKAALRLLIENDFVGLDLFRRGNRTDPRVLKAYQMEDLPPPIADQGQAA